MIQTFRFNSPRETAQEAAKKLNEEFARNIPVLFLVSGGSALKILDLLDEEIFDKRVTVGVLDERFSTDPAINNFAQLTQTNFYKKIVTKGVGVIDTHIVPGEKPTDLATRWEKTLRDWKSNNPDGVVIITQGIGIDGHTAGIMPYPENSTVFGELFENFDTWVVAYDAQGKNPYPLRVTTTIPFLAMVDVSIVYVCGVDKLYALKKSLKEGGALAETPARIIHQMKRVFLFTDQAVS